MVLIHVVLLRMNLEALEEPGKEAELEARIKSLAEIEEVLEVTFGRQVAPYIGYESRSQTYTHALVVKVANGAALLRYSKHADHKSIVQKNIRPLLDARKGDDRVDPVCAMDFEDPDCPVPSDESSSNNNASTLAQAFKGPLFWPHTLMGLTLVGLIGYIFARPRL